MCCFYCLFSSALCQNFLHRLLFLQQESSHDALLDTRGTDSTTVGTRDSSFPLLKGVVFGGFDVLDSLKRLLAVSTLGTVGGLVNSLRL